MVLPGAGPMGEDEHSERSPLRGICLCAELSQLRRHDSLRVLRVQSGV